MSQGGNNEVARLNVAITGDVAPLAAAAKQAEQVVQQSAAKIETIAATTASSVQGMGAGVGSGLAGSGIGGARGAAGVGGVPEQAAGFSKIGESAKGALRPIMSLVQAFSQLTLVAGLFIGAGVGIYNWLTAGARAAKQMSADIEELGKKSEEAFGRFEKKQSETAAQRFQNEMDELEKIYEGFYKEIQDIRDKQFNRKTKTWDSEEQLRKAAALELKYTEGYTKAAGAIRQRFEDDYYKEQVETARKAKELRDKELNEIREHTRKIRDFWRDVRGDQVSGFAVEGFQTSNLSQSLDLLARQRGGVDGPKQLRVDYGGTR